MNPCFIRFFRGVLFLSIIVSGFLTAHQIHASIQPALIHVSDSKKTQTYIQDGIFIGGDRSIDSVVIKDIRRAKNGEQERIVLDLEGSMNGEPAAIARSPYYQVAMNKEEGRAVITLWGKPRLQFDTAKVLKGFQKSALINSIEMLPKLESDSWTFVLGFKEARSIEVFELADPVRIILDVKKETKKKVKLAH